METIFKQGKTYDIDMLLTVQLVSKSWQAATLKAFSGCFKIKIQNSEATKLIRLCQKLPNMSSLELKSRGNFCNLSPISKCTNLSSLVLDHRSDLFFGGNHNHLDPALLPPGLRDLRTYNWTYDMNRLQHFKSVGITSLHLCETWNRLPDIYKLLEQLPDVKVGNSL